MGWCRHRSSAVIAASTLWILILFLRPRPTNLTDVFCSEYLSGQSGSGVLRSYNFPFNYRNELHCVYHLYLGSHPSPRIVCLTFHRFKLQACGDTKKHIYDYLLVNKTRYCFNGEAYPYDSSHPAAYQSIWKENMCYTTSDDWLELEFHSDISNGYPGFYARYTVYKADEYEEKPEVTDGNTAPCEDKEFTCFDRKCISDRLTCNGKNDCDDGSDENYMHAPCHGKSFGDQTIDACSFGYLSREETCDIEVERWSAVTTSPHGYPVRDHTVGDTVYDAIGMFVRASFNNSSEPSLLMAGVVSVESEPKCLSFWYYMGGRSVGRLSVHWRRPGTSKNPVWTRDGGMQPGWLHGEVLLEGHREAELTFEAVPGSNRRADIALDDLYVYPGPCVGGDISCTFQLGLCGWTVEHVTGGRNWERVHSLRPVPHNTKEQYNEVVVLFNQNSTLPKISRLVSPVVISGSTTKCFVFYSWMNAYSRNAKARLDVRVKDYNGVLQQPVWTSENAFGRQALDSVTIDGNAQKPLQVVFEGMLQGAAISIDNVFLQDAPCSDIDLIACLPGQFKCLDGQCVSGSKVGDGRNDCVDGSDETDTTTATSSTAVPTCRPDMFQCSDGRCIFEYYVCDGYYHCSGGEEEQNCTMCRGGAFKCDTGQCIPYSAKCDGVEDCRDGSDENQCTANPASRVQHLSSGALIGVIFAALVATALIAAKLSLLIQKHKPFENCCYRLRRWRDRSGSDVSDYEAATPDNYLTAPPPDYYSCVNRAFEPDSQTQFSSQKDAPPSYEEVLSGRISIISPASFPVQNPNGNANHLQGTIRDPSIENDAGNAENSELRSDTDHQSGSTSRCSPPATNRENHQSASTSQAQDSSQANTDGSSARSANSGRPSSQNNEQHPRSTDSNPSSSGELQQNQSETVQQSSPTADGAPVAAIKPMVDNMYAAIDPEINTPGVVLRLEQENQTESATDTLCRPHQIITNTAHSQDGPVTENTHLNNLTATAGTNCDPHPEIPESYSVPEGDISPSILTPNVDAESDYRVPLNQKTKELAKPNQNVKEMTENPRPEGHTWESSGAACDAVSVSNIAAAESSRKQVNERQIGLPCHGASFMESSERPNKSSTTENLIVTEVRNDSTSASDRVPRDHSAQLPSDSTVNPSDGFPKVPSQMAIFRSQVQRLSEEDTFV